MTPPIASLEQVSRRVPQRAENTVEHEILVGSKWLVLRIWKLIPMEQLEHMISANHDLLNDTGFVLVDKILPG